MPKKAASEAAPDVIPAKRIKKGASPKELQTAGAPDSASAILMQALLAWPAVDIQDVNQVQTRIAQYLDLCTQHQIRPGVVGMATSLGISRNRLYDIKMGIQNPYTKKYDVPNEVRNLIKKVYSILESLWEYNMQSGKVNPPCGIFLGKNYFGYQDVVDYNITPKQDTSVLPSEDLQKRLESLPED